MSEKIPPSNFITPASIDNLSIAGVSVWLICIVIESINSNIDAFWIRVSALSISCIWSLSLFIKNKRWNKPTNYIIILVNAVLIYVNAAGLNTVTRQSPFEGRGIKTDLDSIKKNSFKQTAIFGFVNQKDWYPNYSMVRYVDTLNNKIKKAGLLINELNKRVDSLNKIVDSVHNLEIVTHVRGEIKDDNGNPVANAQVNIIESEDDNTKNYYVVTDENGNYGFVLTNKNLVKKTFNLLVKKNGFSSFESTVSYGEASNINLRLTHIK